jgi:hypothetical protein
MIAGYNSGDGETRWYTIHCNWPGKTHQKVFGADGKDILKAAGKHVQSWGHRDGEGCYESKTRYNTIRLLGTRVLHCDAQKVKLNNDAVREWWNISHGAAVESNKSPTTLVTREPLLSSQSNIPLVGKPYFLHGGESGNNVAVIVLPVSSFGTVGVNKGSFHDELAHNAPRCYQRGHDGDRLRYITVAWFGQRATRTAASW